MIDKMTDDEVDAGCLMLGCFGLLLAFSVFAVLVTVFVLIVRQVPFGW